VVAVNMNDAATTLNTLQQGPHRETECCLANWDTSKLSSGPKHSKKIESNSKPVL